MTQLHDGRAVELLTPGAAPAPTGLADFGLTVQECLAIAPLTKASVCGGAPGLSRRARWVHVIDHEDIEDSLTGGELILSSGVSLGHSVSLQRAIFPIMERRSSAGLILSLGTYIPRVPDAMVREAERFGIPLIAMPWEVNFRDITQVLLTRIVRAQYQLLEDAESINRSLLRIALNRGTLETLCARLAEATERRVAMVDPAFEIVAASPTARCDPQFPRMFVPASTAEARLPPKLEVETVRTLQGRWALKAPIMITSRLQGYLMLDTEHDRPERFEGMIVEAATLVAALLIAQTEEIERVRTSRERDSFQALIEGSQEPAKIAALGPIPPGPYSIMAVDVEGGAVETDRRVLRRALDQMVPQARISEYAQQFIALLPHSRRHLPRDIAEAALERFESGRAAVRIAMSRPFGTLEEVRDAYAETQEVISVGRVLDPDARILCAEDNAALRQFVRSLAGTKGGFAHVKRLADQDAMHGSEFVRTLECFLVANQNAAVAARKLAIHRHTLAYRLERIVDLLGVPLGTEISLDLRLQLIAFRMAAARKQ